MKTPMSAEEWLDENITEKTPVPDGLDAIPFLMELYSTYLLKHHLEQFAEECKEKIKIKEVVDWYGNKIDEVIDAKSIDQTLNDYLTKNGIV